MSYTTTCRGELTALRNSAAIVIPPLDVLAGQIINCRDELTALRKLYRMACAARDAEQARQRRASGPPPQAPQKGGSDAP
jgi:hypothetical protein